MMKSYRKKTKSKKTYYKASRPRSLYSNQVSAKCELIGRFYLNSGNSLTGFSNSAQTYLNVTTICGNSPTFVNLSNIYAKFRINSVSIKVYRALSDHYMDEMYSTFSALPLTVTFYPAYTSTATADLGIAKDDCLDISPFGSTHYKKWPCKKMENTPYSNWFAISESAFSGQFSVRDWSAVNSSVEKSTHHFKVTLYCSFSELNS